MALASVEEVRRRGGLNSFDDFRLFRVEDEAELDDMVAEDLALASAWLSDRVDAAYYTGSATANTARDLLFKRAECLLAMHFITLPLKARKVEGTHWAVDQEDASSFAELIDNEYLKAAELLIEPFVEITTDDTPFALPVMVVTTPVDRSTLTPVPCQLQDNLDEANGLVGTWP